MTTLSLATAVSALQANQTALHVVSQNIANAHTPGYHRQVPLFTERRPVELDNLILGSGVDVAQVRRVHHAVTEEAITRNVAERANVSARLDTARRVEALLTPGQGAIHDRLVTFFQDLQRLSAQPDNDAVRRITLGSAASLTQSVNDLSTQLFHQGQEIRARVGGIIEQIEVKSNEISAINKQLRPALARGQSPNNLLDRRDQLVNELAELIDVQTYQAKGIGTEVVLHETRVQLANGSVLIGEDPVKLDASLDINGQLIIRRSGTAQVLDVTGGELGGLLDSYNEMLPRYTATIEDFARELADQMNGIHATGLGIGSGFTQATSKRPILDTNDPLANVLPNSTLQAGELYVGITRQGTTPPERSVHKLSIDPRTESLQDIAAKFSSVDHLQAIIDSQTGAFIIQVEPGYSFDFTGSNETTPAISTLTGTSQARIGGKYLGATNDQVTLRISGTGTVGATDGLRLEILNNSGNVVGSHSLGSDYEVGSSLAIGNTGLTVSLSAGTVNQGESFTTPMAAKGDSTGVLAAIGINPLFVGDKASTLRVNPDLLVHPDRFAISATGAPGNIDRLTDLLRLRTQGVGSSRTLEDQASGMAAAVGTEVSDLEQIETNFESVSQYLEAQRASASGVDPNEELAHMLLYQKAFASASRLVATVDEMFQDLIDMVR